MWRSWSAELTRLGSVRSQRTGALLATAAAPLGSLLVGATDHLGATSSLAAGAAAGTTFGLIGFGAWAAASAAGEYAHGTIQVTVATGGTRRRIVLASVGASATVALVGGLVATLLGLLLTWSVQPPGSHPAGNILGLAVIPLAYACVAAVGAATGLISRSSAWATALITALLVAPQTAAGLLGGIRPVVIGAVPSVVVTQIVNIGQVPASQQFPAGPALAVVAVLAVTGVAVAGAVGTVSRRDGG